MRQFIRVYRFVNLSKELIDELDKQHYANKNELSGYHAAHVLTRLAKEKFVELHKSTDLQEAHYICSDAIQSGYLEGVTYTFNDAKVDTICLTRKGRKLLDFPLGTMQEFLQEYGLVISFLSGAVAIALLQTAWKFIKLIG